MDFALTMTRLILRLLGYLRDDLQYEEARVFFEQARYRGEAQFEDDYDGQWTIKYNRSTGGYLLVKRS